MGNKLILNCTNCLLTTNIIDKLLLHGCLLSTNHLQTHLQSIINNKNRIRTNSISSNKDVIGT